MSVDIPSLSALPAKPKSVILHWTGGGPKASEFEKGHYHYLIEQDGNVVAGVPVQLNMHKVSEKAPYAAHTRGMNSYRVGVSFCGMAGATMTNLGKYPLTEKQVLKGCEFIADLCLTWGLEPDENGVFTHAEAQRIHGVRQNGKFDIDVLAFEPDLKPTEVGHYLRELVRQAMV